MYANCLCISDSRSLPLGYVHTMINPDSGRSPKWQRVSCPLSCDNLEEDPTGTHLRIRLKWSCSNRLIMLSTVYIVSSACKENNQPHDGRPNPPAKDGETRSLKSGQLGREMILPAVGHAMFLFYICTYYLICMECEVG
jgi:hypothetical protein